MTAEILHNVVGKFGGTGRSDL